MGVRPVRSVLYLYPKAGEYGTVVEFFRSERILELSAEGGGCLGASLHVPISGQGPILVLATWREEADYQRWADNPRRAALAAGLLARLERAPTAAELYSTTIELPT